MTPEPNVGDADNDPATREIVVPEDIVSVWLELLNKPFVNVRAPTIVNGP